MRELCTTTLEITSNHDDNLSHIIYNFTTSTAFGTSMKGWRHWVLSRTSLYY